MENRVLENNRVLLVQNGEFREIRDHLLQEGVLSMYDTEIIEAERARHKQMSTLLDVMCHKPAEYEKRFLECLLEADEVLYKQLDLFGTKGKGRVEPMSTRTSALCDPHHGKITMFCEKCDVALCHLCFEQSHSGHNIKKIKAAFVEKKASLEKLEKSWAAEKQSLEEARSKLWSVKGEMEATLDQRIADIKGRYQKQIEALHQQCKEEINSVQSLRDKSSPKINDVTVDVDRKLKEMDNLQERFAELCRSEGFLVKEATDLAKRMEEQISWAKKGAEKAEQQLKEVRTVQQDVISASTVNRTDTGSDNLVDANTQTEGADHGGPQDTPTAAPTNTPTYSCASTQTPGEISVPELRFTRADGRTPERVVIEAGGAAVSDGPQRARWNTSVRTDGLVGADRPVYWETRLDWSRVSVPGSDWEVGSVGARREGSDFGRVPGNDDQSWGVWIRYHHSQKMWWYDCLHGGEVIFESSPVTATSPSGSHRLGLLLDPGAGTLTAVDVNTNSRLYTFSLPAGDAGSQRLVPVVGFGEPSFERRFSLPGVYPSRLPGAITDLLN